MYYIQSIAREMETKMNSQPKNSIAHSETEVCSEFPFYDTGQVIQKLNLNVSSAIFFSLGDIHDSLRLRKLGPVRRVKSQIYQIIILLTLFKSY